MPIQLVQALRRHRTMIPVPATYLAAALVGAVVGVAAQLLVGWPWWLVAAAVVAAVWLFFASTALCGAGGSSQPLATDLLRVVRPHKAIERDQQQEVGRFRAAPFPLYGLPPAWWAKGQRSVTTALSLGHGDPLAEAGSQLRVEGQGRAPGPRSRSRWMAGRSASCGWRRAATGSPRPNWTSAR